MSPPEGGAPKLTDATVADLACPEGRKDVLVFDATEPGFGVRVTADGKRVFVFQYRVGSTVRRHRIGVWGKGLPATKARREAERLRGMVREGRDPVAEKRAREAETAASDRAARAAAAVEAFTFGKLVEGWETKGLAHRRPSYVKDATGRLRLYFASWLNRAAADVTKAEAIQALDRVEQDRGTTSARRALAYARACYGWALKRDLLSINPFAGVAALGRENPRDRVLTDTEVGAIWRGAETMGGTSGAFLRCLLLTLQRREEVAGMRWEEITPDRLTWTIPAERAKNGKAHLVHLPDQVRVILAGMPRERGNPHVFIGRRKGSVGGFSHMKDELVRTIAGAEPARSGRRRKAKPDAVAAVDWRFHDFRRTGVTALATMGIPPHVADKLLNHVTGSIQGVAAVYQRAEFLGERKRAIEAWAAHVLACAEGEKAGNVVDLPRRAATA